MEVKKFAQLCDMSAKTLDLGQYKLSIPAKWKLNGERNKIEEQIKKIFEDSGFFQKVSKKLPKKGEGLCIERFFTQEEINPFDTVTWVKRDCRIANPDGSAVFEMKNAEVPSTFSQVASDVIISKYFRKAGVPQCDEHNNQILNESGSPVLGPERSAKQVFKRLVACWRHWGEQYGYFKSQDDAQIFEDELSFMLIHQMAAPNSPQWFNTGLAYMYNITGKPQGHYYVDPATETLTRSQDSYSRPQPHACFIQSIKDDLVNQGGIMDLWSREARIFKYGSGTGTNFSSIRGRGEILSGGGTSSGLMSFLKIGNAAAGAIKSGGTTRRAAKMVCLDIDHPEIEAFISWKANEEKKVKAMVEAGYSSEFEGEAYQTVSGQNSNNSVRIPHEFMNALEKKENWNLTWRTDGRICKTMPAEKLWELIALSAWASADPGIQFHSTINEWHTCPNSGPIRASNPCSEYMFLDDTACNLASLNLMKFFDQKTNTFDVPAFSYATRLWTIVLEISVLMAQFPSKAIAQKSYDFRTLGLGYANLGTMLMVMGIPYDSSSARGIGSAITALMTAEAYAASAEMAKHLGPFPHYELNKKSMLRVIRNHRRAAYSIGTDETHTSSLHDYENLLITPVELDPHATPAYLLTAARTAWDKALSLGEQYGYRNAQTTVIAPPGTTGLLMDCDTTGVEPDFALVKFKKLAGGGYWKIPNRSLEPALKTLGYSPSEVYDIVSYVIGVNTLTNDSPINRATLLKKGLREHELNKIEEELPRVFELKHAFNNYVLGEETLQRLGFSKEQYASGNFNLLDALGFLPENQEKANKVICGHHTTEGAPHVKPEHRAVFDCANKCGDGVRFIDPMGHVHMLAATQPFISGSISKTINLPREATPEEIKKIYLESWKRGLKSVALYRDGSKLSQPLSSSRDSKNKDAAKLDTPVKKDPVQPAPVLVSCEPQGQLSFIQRGTKKELPVRRHGITVEATVGGHKLFVRTGEYEDGTLGEIFIDMHKEGAAFRSLLNCFAIAVSLGLQYGVPLKKYVDKFTFTRFEPNGFTDHPNIKSATSIIDFIFRLLGMEYLQQLDFIHVAPQKATSLEKDAPQKTLAFPSALPSSHEQEGIETKPSDTRVHELSQLMSTLMGDAPACSECGHITVRSGSCYRCLNCGSSMGCS